jgi:hypothetical protein
MVSQLFFSTDPHEPSVKSVGFLLVYLAYPVQFLVFISLHKVFWTLKKMGANGGISGMGQAKANEGARGYE